MNSQKWNFEEMLSGSPVRPKGMLTTETPRCTRSRPVPKWVAVENQQGMYEDVPCQFSAPVLNFERFCAPYVKFDQTKKQRSIEHSS